LFDTLPAKCLLKHAETGIYLPIFLKETIKLNELLQLTLASVSKFLVCITVSLKASIASTETI
jgi:hypothetical protein